MPSFFFQLVNIIQIDINCNQIKHIIQDLLTALNLIKKQQIICQLKIKNILKKFDNSN